MKYRTIVADPPWPLGWSAGGVRRGASAFGRATKGRPTLGYPTMSVEAICALPVAEFAEDDAHLYLWIPDRFLIDGTAALVGHAWGFTPLRLIVWKKPNYGLGRFPRPQHEVLVVCRSGDLGFRVGDVGSVQEWPQVYARAGQSVAKVNSAKPDAALDLVERASPGPYLELFARRNRLGWDTWGNEALEHVQLGEDVL